jgi:hypothetical protein
VPLGRDASTGGWLVEPGELEIRLGRSSRDPRTTARLTVT